LLKKTRKRAFRQFKWPRPQCVKEMPGLVGSETSCILEYFLMCWTVMVKIKGLLRCCLIKGWIVCPNRRVWLKKYNKMADKRLSFIDEKLVGNNRFIFVWNWFLFYFILVRDWFMLYNYNSWHPKLVFSCLARNSPRRLWDTKTR
jgi:hypothetical protein